MTAAVVDASLALSWCFEDEATAETDALFEQVRDQGAVVPQLWHLELGNVLLQAERRQRIDQAGVGIRLALIADLPILTDHETYSRAWTDILALARRETLTTYDAAYLELALRLQLPLFTRDTALARAARRLELEIRP